MSKKGAQKSGGRDNSAADKKRAANMKAAGVRRTTMRDPITNKLVAMGTYPGGYGRIQG